MADSFLDDMDALYEAGRDGMEDFASQTLDQALDDAKWLGSTYTDHVVNGPSRAEAREAIPDTGLDYTDRDYNNRPSMDMDR